MYRISSTIKNWPYHIKYTYVYKYNNYILKDFHTVWFSNLSILSREIMNSDNLHKWIFSVPCNSHYNANTSFAHNTLVH